MCTLSGFRVGVHGPKAQPAKGSRPKAQNRLLVTRDLMVSSRVPCCFVSGSRFTYNTYTYIYNTHVTKHLSHKKVHVIILTSHITYKQVTTKGSKFRVVTSSPSWKKFRPEIWWHSLRKLVKLHGFPGFPGVSHPPPVDLEFRPEIP